MNEVSVSFAISKFLSSLAGLFGGLSISFFHHPKKLHQYGTFTAGAIIGGISVFASFAVSGLVAKQVGLNFEDSDVALGVGYFVGIVSVGIIALLAKFFENRQDKDLMDVIQEIKKPVTRKPRVRKIALKQAAKTTAKRGKNVS